jgi:copper transport protein
VRLALTDPAAGIGPLTVQANRQEPGHWTTPPLTLPSPGPWQVKLVLLVTDFEQVTLSGELVTEGQTE